MSEERNQTIRIQRMSATDIEALKVIASEQGFKTYQDMLRTVIGRIITDKILPESASLRLEKLVATENEKTRDVVNHLTEVLKESLEDFYE